MFIASKPNIYFINTQRINEFTFIGIIIGEHEYVSDGGHGSRHVFRYSWRKMAVSNVRRLTVDFTVSRRTYLLIDPNTANMFDEYLNLFITSVTL